jgi:hypothetical protein
MPGFRANDLASCIVAQRRFRLQQQKPTALRAATSGFASNNLASPLGRSHVHLEGDSPRDDNGAQKAQQFAT